MVDVVEMGDVGLVPFDDPLDLAPGLARIQEIAGRPDGSADRARALEFGVRREILFMGERRLSGCRVENGTTVWPRDSRSSARLKKAVSAPARR